MTQLLVSVRSVSEAKAALRGGAHLIDVKEPARGPLGKADDVTIAEIVLNVAKQVPVSAAMGELEQFAIELTTKQSLVVAWSPDHATEAPESSRSVWWSGQETGPQRAYATHTQTALTDQKTSSFTIKGLAYVKLGLAGSQNSNWPLLLMNIARSLETANLECKLVTVAYADWQRANAPDVDAVSSFALSRPGSIFLLDTFNKDLSPCSLLDFLSISRIGSLCKRCREANVRIALAGSLTPEQIVHLLPAKPDWIAVRSAACEGGRNGVVSERKVSILVEMLTSSRCES